MKKFKLFIVSVIAIVCLVVSGGVFTSCTNDDDLLLAGDTQTEQVSPLVQDSVKAVTRGMKTHPLYNIPSGTYGIAQAYKNNYSHINQYDQSPTSNYQYGWPGNVSNPGNCSWSTYVMAVGCVGRAEGTIASNDYKLDKARRLKQYVYNHLPTSQQSYLNAADITNITNLYVNVWDNGIIANIQLTPYNKYAIENIAYGMISHLKNNHSPLVYLGSAGSIGHYYTVVSIVWTGNLSSSDVWYCDSRYGNTDDPFPASGTTSAFRLSMNLQDFIETAQNNSNNYANIWYISPI